MLVIGYLQYSDSEAKGVQLCTRRSKSTTRELILRPSRQCR